MTKIKLEQVIKDNIKYPLPLRIAVLIFTEKLEVDFNEIYKKNKDIEQPTLITIQNYIRDIHNRVIKITPKLLEISRQV